MKFKFLKITCLTLLAALIYSCSSESDAIDEPRTIKKSKDQSELEIIAASLEKNEDYLNFIESYLQESIKTAENEAKIQSDKLPQEEIDYLRSQSMESIYKIDTYLTMLVINNPDLVDLTPEEAQIALTIPLRKAFDDYLGSNLRTKSSERTLTSIVGDYADNRDTFIKTYPSPQYATYGLTLGEAMGCVIGAAFTFVAENWGVAKQLVGILKGEAITFGIVKAAVQLAFPQTKAVWTILGLVGCLLGGAIS